MTNDHDDDQPAADLPPRAHSPTLIEFSPASLSDTALGGCYRSAAMWAQSGAAAAMATELSAGLHHEIKRRMNNQDPDAVPQEPDLLRFNFNRWSDRDVADALILLTMFSYQSEHVEFGLLVDAILGVITQCAADRLLASGDPRNPIHPWQRWHTPAELQQMLGGGQRDPETN